MQQSALQRVYALEGAIKGIGDRDLLDDWRKLQTSDHFYYMCTKWFSDGDVHKYFNPYESPYQSYIAFMNIIGDLEMRIAGAIGEKERIEIGARSIKKDIAKEIARERKKEELKNKNKKGI